VLCFFWIQASSYLLKQLVKIPTRTNNLHTIYCIIVIKCRISGNTHKSKAKQEESQNKIGFIYHGLDFCFPRRTGHTLKTCGLLNSHSEHTFFSKLKLQRRLQFQTDPTALHAPNVSRSISSLSDDLHVRRPAVTTQEHVLCVRILRMEEAVCRPHHPLPLHSHSHLRQASMCVYIWATCRQPFHVHTLHCKS
jgi:hypothetical protein